VPAACGPSVVTIPQRLVRLTNAQVANSLTAALGADATKDIMPDRRVFMQLFEEGQTVDAPLLRKSMAWAEAAAATVEPRFMSFTGCAPGTATDACVQTFLRGFATKVYRRPVTNDEMTSLMMVYTQTKTGGTPQEGVSYAMQALLNSPMFLHRTEIGTPGANNEARLTSSEMASLLSYVLLNGPPDQGLLDAATANTLITADGIATQVTRLLSAAGGSAQNNLVEAMKAFIELELIDNIPKDGALGTTLSIGLRNAMYNETERFLRETMWKRKVNDLLTSRGTFVNRDLASFYGITWPGASDDPLDTFLAVEAPAARLGLLTQGSIMASRARTDNTSVVSRGLFVDGRILCNTRPPEPPETIRSQVEMQLMDPTQNERQKADHRAKTDPCVNCHRYFDAYGLVLENFDAIGRYRTTYPDGMAIDPSGMLPAALGGSRVADAADFAVKATESGAFSLCMTLNMTRYALTQVAGGLDRNESTVCNANKRFSTTGGDGTFTSMMREILTSRIISIRAVGGAI
jgi:hypothetical protein